MEDNQRPQPQADMPQPVRLLLLEDNAADAELAQRLLGRAGLRLTTIVVETRAAFVEQLAAFGPDIILSDFALPGFSGAAALEIAQDRYPDIPVIIWSGVLGDEAAVELIKHGATDYILKDRPARLPSAIRRALAEAGQRARLARLEAELHEAQRLASLGQLAAAEQALSHTREQLAAARREAMAADNRPDAPPGSSQQQVSEHIT
jgi:DNA-binding NtrC family response regulator